jgi:hypothetical protein
MNAPWPAVIFAGCLVIGVAGICFAFHLTTRSSRFLVRASRHPGLILELVSKGEGEFAPRYSFRDPTGIERVVVSGVSSYPARYVVGQTVDVLFDSASGESKLDNWLERRGVEVVCFVLFGAVLLAGVGGLIILVS